MDFRGKNKIWDIHPLISIIKGLGGIVTTWRNESANKAGNVLISANKIKKILALKTPDFKYLKIFLIFNFLIIFMMLEFISF